jgi:kynureninase
MMRFSTSFELAQKLDKQDNLAHFRESFVVSDPDLIYLDGNSLGRLPKATIGHMQELIERDWGDRLIRLWNDGWSNTPTELGAKIAGLIGAQPDEVLVCESTSTNLFKLAAAALRARPERNKIVSDVFNFPTDLYIFQGIIDLLGNRHQLELIPSRDSITIHPEDIISSLDEDTALLSLTHVAFKSAFMHDMEVVTGLAHQVGALTLWDLSHSVGAVPIQLNSCDVDLAVGCTYKYLNGGPGAPAFLYVRKDLQPKLIPPIWGWFAAKAPFDFELEFKPSADISRFRIGTPPMLSMKAIEPAVDLHLQAGMDHLRQKSVLQTEYLIYLASEWLFPLGFSLGSPVDPAQRGSHVSLRHPEAFRICRAMIESKPPAVRVIPDFRTPDNIRLGITPIYTSFTDIHRALDRIRVILTEVVYERFSGERQGVT